MKSDSELVKSGTPMFLTFFIVLVGHVHFTHLYDCLTTRPAIPSDFVQWASTFQRIPFGAFRTIHMSLLNPNLILALNLFDPVLCTHVVIAMHHSTENTEYPSPYEHIFHWSSALSILLHKHRSTQKMQP